MKIYINDEIREIRDSSTISSLILDLDLDIKKIAIERNLEIIPLPAYESTMLSEGDKIEIVHFIGGG